MSILMHIKYPLSNPPLPSEIYQLPKGIMHRLAALLYGPTNDDDRLIYYDYILDRIDKDDDKSILNKLKEMIYNLDEDI